MESDLRMKGRNHRRNAAARTSHEKLWAAMEAIWKEQAAAGQPAPTAEEDDARLRKQRRSWPEGYFGRPNSTQRES